MRWFGQHQKVALAGLMRKCGFTLSISTSNETKNQASEYLLISLKEVKDVLREKDIWAILISLERPQPAHEDVV